MGRGYAAVGNITERVFAESEAAEVEILDEAATIRIARAA
jgi:hypothetical protein